MWHLMRDKKEWMRRTFGRPEQAKENLSLTSLLFSDQIPFWVKVTPGRQAALRCRRDEEIRADRRRRVDFPLEASFKVGPFRPQI